MTSLIQKGIKGHIHALVCPPTAHPDAVTRAEGPTVDLVVDLGQNGVPVTGIQGHVRDLDPGRHGQGKSPDPGRNLAGSHILGKDPGQNRAGRGSEAKGRSLKAGPSLGRSR